MQAERVAGGDDLVEGREAEALGLPDVVGRRDIVGEHTHAQRGTEAGDKPPDRAVPDHAERAALPGLAGPEERGAGPIAAGRRSAMLGRVDEGGHVLELLRADDHARLARSPASGRLTGEPARRCRRI